MMNFGRTGFSSFRRSAPGFFKSQQQFKNFARMQPAMSFSQMNNLSQKIMMSQLAQGRLSSANMLLMNIQMNYLLLNEETENGLNPLSEDLGMSNSP